MKKIPFLVKIKNWASLHKIASTLIIIVVILVGYYIFGKIRSANTPVQYVLSPAHIGTITQTVTGSGQVSSENQLDITSEVSGTILSINAVIGQKVRAGNLIATIDSRDALADLQSAQIALAKLTEPAKVGEVTSAQNIVSKAYSDGTSAISDAFLELPIIMTGLNDMLYSRSGFLSDQQSSNLTTTAQGYRTTAGISYDKSNNQYLAVLQEYKDAGRTSSTSTTETLISHTYDLMSSVSETLRNTQNAVTYTVKYMPDYNSSGSASAATNITTWSNTINSSLASLLASKNTIHSSADSLQTLKDGADTLDIQSQQLSLALKTRTYQKYFIRAPFDGVIGRIPVNTYDKASGGTVVATIASDKKITTIPLNEVDAVKVQKGNKVTLTFDAISGLQVNGTVTQIDLIGTETQGVVTYNVKIAFNGTDSKIRTGMSVNVVIITEEKDGVLIVPSSAIKGQGQRKYVEVIDNPTIIGNIQKTTATNQTASSTGVNSFRQNQPVTVSSPTAPRQVVVVTGDSDDVNTEIISGIEDGQKIVIRTITGTALTAQSTTPSLFNLGGSGQRPATGAVRAVSR